MYILRNKNTHEAINVSYSPQGLIWTSNSTGKLVACKDAYIKADKDSEVKNGMLTSYLINGDTRLSNNFYIEPYDFNKVKVFKSNKLNKSEKLIALKAKRISYSSWANNTETADVNQ